MDQFDYDKWLESVESHVVKITRPDDYGDVLGVIEPPGFKVGSETYCGKCHGFRMLIKREDEVIGHCPCCNRNPGMLELGTDTLPDKPKPEYIRNE